jgi:hypothetical protein
VSGQHHVPAALPPYSLYSRLCGPQNRYGRCGEENIFYPSGTWTTTPCCSYITNVQHLSSACLYAIRTIKFSNKYFTVELDFLKLDNLLRTSPYSKHGATYISSYYPDRTVPFFKPYFAYFEKNESTVMGSPCCVSVNPSPTPHPSSFQCLNQSLWNSVCMSWHVSPSPHP